VAACAAGAIVVSGSDVAQSAGGSGAAKITVIAQASKSGRRAQALASGLAGSFGKLSVRVTARPTQRVTGTWSIVCVSPPGLTSRAGDAFKGRSPLTVAMSPIPRPTPNARCSVVVTGKLTKAGRVRVQLLGK
jgi:hypothetical protein